MLFSTMLLKNAIVKATKDPGDCVKICSDKDLEVSPVLQGCFIFIFSVLFILEIIVLYYSIIIATKTTKKGPERTVNVILACLMPFPYMMFNILLNPQAREVLGSTRC